MPLVASLKPVPQSRSTWLSVGVALRVPSVGAVASTVKSGVAASKAVQALAAALASTARYCQS